jgi:diaminopimelate epimerase
MQFTKMHGIGNDFIMIDCLSEDGPALLSEAQTRASDLCDRHFGIGADGVITVSRGHAGTPAAKSRFAMRMFNPDGTEAEMCGNGIRCFAKYVYDRGYSRGETDLPVETGAGLLRVHILVGPNGKADRVRVDMGAPILVPRLIPTTLSEGETPIVDRPLALSGRTLAVTTVSMGNPHAVTFVEDVASFPVAEIGPQVEKHPAFPKRTNTEFVQLLSRNEMNFRVWERGAGETMACGTGACAAAVAGDLTGRTARQVLIHLLGGDLEIDWSESDNHVFMTGSANEVFSGDV